MLDILGFYKYNTNQQMEESADMPNKDVYFAKGIEYDTMTDEGLVALANKNDQQALNTLLDRYKETVNMKVTKYYINGAEKEDIAQEGMIGLYKSIKGFDSEKQNSFKTFANLCIERQIITFVKGSNRQKHIPLNSYISLNNPTYESENGDEEAQLIDVLGSNVVEDPLDTLTKSEYYERVEKSINNSLSDFEKQVLNKFIEGQSYVEIAESLNSPIKSVDNAIQRIRKKTTKNIENL
jgi:RNA polymerase sporulation-specific sigma factor